MGPFVRTDAKMDQLGFIRGPAMLYAAPLTQTIPTQIGDIVKLTGPDVNEVQTLTITGTPTGGTFKLTFRGQTTGVIAYDAVSTTVQAALEALTTIAPGNIVGAGGPLPATPVVLTFQGALAGSNVPLITVSTPAFTGGTTPAATVAETTAGSGVYDPIGSWFFLGGTKNGIVPGHSSTEEEFTIDQQTTPIGSAPNTHEWNYQTSLVQTTLENLAFAWDMGPVTLNTVPTIPEKRLGMGTPTFYTTRRIAIIHRRPVLGLLRAHFFYTMQCTPVDSSLTYASQGEQQSVPVRMRALPNELISDEYSNCGFLLDQYA